jgi:hypothetical protein
LEKFLDEIFGVYYLNGQEGVVVEAIGDLVRKIIFRNFFRNFFRKFLEIFYEIEFFDEKLKKCVF